MQLVKNAIILEQFYPAGTDIECSVEVAEQGYKQYERELVREKIKQATGMDNTSLLGVTNDSVHVLTYVIAVLYRAVNNAESLDDLKAQTADFAHFADDFLSKIENQEIKLPYLTNSNKGGVAGVMQSLIVSANGTSDAMEQV